MNIVPKLPNLLFKQCFPFRLKLSNDCVYSVAYSRSSKVGKSGLKVSKKNTFYVTTPIYYANAEPHIGHLYTSVIADAIARWQHLFHKNSKIKFSTGTDEHGSKIQAAATSNNCNPSEYCDKISESYQNLAEDFDIDYTDFIRTTDRLHLDTVIKFWRTLFKNGHIYTADYEGWYCVSDETFYSESQLKEVSINGDKKVLVSEESGHPVEWTKEQNYLFKLSKFQNDLIKWLERNEGAVKPKKFYKILLNSLTKEQLPDVSVSRPSSRVSWGIPVPSDPSQTIYVWLDALVNYLTVAGYLNERDGNFSNIWPPDVQIIGKDILKFHGIYWPAFLMAANLEPPHSIFCHSHWTVALEKMSKSKKNIVDPFECANVFTNDGLRYFLLRAGVAHNDGNYQDMKAIRILNTELADTLGNLLNRCTSETLNPNQVFPEINSEKFHEMKKIEVASELIESLRKLPETCRRHYDSYNFYKVVDAVIATLHSANLFFESMKPWELRKQTEKYEEMNVVLHLTIETLRVCGIILQPIIPNISSNLLDKLNVNQDERYYENLSEFSWDNPEFHGWNLTLDRIVLFRRILLEDKKKIRLK